MILQEANEMITEVVRCI